MAKKPYEIFFTVAAEEHLDFIERKHRRAILDAIRDRLCHDPLVETRNRKPLLRASRLGDRVWELRVGTGNRFRVFYDVDEAARTVDVVAVGEKIRNKIVILGEEIEP
jgi:mRNA-degrading endonuclease RelE of RelBE toxin-antitoxin system